jgi:hypothetical protein
VELNRCSPIFLHGVQEDDFTNLPCSKTTKPWVSPFITKFPRPVSQATTYDSLTAIDIVRRTRGEGWECSNIIYPALKTLSLIAFLFIDFVTITNHVTSYDRLLQYSRAVPRALSSVISYYKIKPSLNFTA